MFSSATFDSLNLLATKLDPKGKVTPFIEGGVKAIANRMSPATPGVANGARSKDAAVTRGEPAGGLQAVWLWVKANKITAAVAGIGLVAVLWFVAKRR